MGWDEMSWTGSKESSRFSSSLSMVSTLRATYIGSFPVDLFLEDPCYARRILLPLLSCHDSL